MAENTLYKSGKIHAKPSKIRSILTEDDTIRQRADHFSPGTYAQGERKEGGTMERKTGDKTHVKGVLTTFKPFEEIVTTFYESLPDGTITDKLGNSKETYTITDHGDYSTLDVSTGPISDKEWNERGTVMGEMRDKAMETIKELAEK